MNQQTYTIDDIAKIISAIAYLHQPEALIRSLCTDSRRLSDVTYSLFFALCAKRDGHHYIADAYHSGVRSFVISDRSFDRSLYNDANFLLVENTLNALQSLAAFHRRQFQYPVVAITGSNGKTVVKEWLYQLLSPEYYIIRSAKSYNSQIGVPLSIWQMNSQHTMAIIEAGISKVEEMSRLTWIIQPDIGILTNVGPAHDDGFSSRQEKIKEKLLLFPTVKEFIYAPGYLQSYSESSLPGKRKLTWEKYARRGSSIISVKQIENGRSSIKYSIELAELFKKITQLDPASIENVLICWAFMLELGYDPVEIQCRLSKLHPINMRMELKAGINNCSIIDDSYSLDISSLIMALDFLAQQNQHSKHTLILSDIMSSRTPADVLYGQVATILSNKKVDRLIGIGPDITKQASKFTLEKSFFESTAQLLSQFKDLKFSDEAILLKGARIFQFEEISKALVKKMHGTVLEINLSAIEENLNFYKSLLRPEVKIMVMVKAFSYGSGAFEIASLLQFNRVDYLGVAFLDEGVFLRKAGITIPIMVLNADPSAFDLMIEHHLEPAIYTLRMLKALMSVLDKKNIRCYPIHIEIDTGMRRLGFALEDLPALLRELKNNQHFVIKSVFSHFVASGQQDQDSYTKQQLKQFNTSSDQLEKTIGYPIMRHIANSSGISRWPEAQLNMVRLGIGLYGFDSAYAMHNPLKSVATLKTSISQIKVLKPGDTVGYNRRGILKRGGRIATVRIGYADGYSGRLGNGVGKMFVNGKAVPTVGNICMDMCMLDISEATASEGDEVIVFNDRAGVDDIVSKLGITHYEFLTSISQRVKRVHYYE